MNLDVKQQNKDEVTNSEKNSKKDKENADIPPTNSQQKTEKNGNEENDENMSSGVNQQNKDDVTNSVKGNMESKIIDYK